MTDIAAEIIATEARRIIAQRDGDGAALPPLLAESLTFGHANAIWDDKAQLLAKIASGRILYSALTAEDQRVTVLTPDVALLHQRLTAHVRVEGVDKVIRNTILAVYRRGDAGWQLAAYQPTPVPQV